jgi:chaperonin GroES
MPATGRHDLSLSPRLGWGIESPKVPNRRNADMKVRPLGDKILVKRAEPQSRTESGIYLPESAKYMPFSVRKGDRVIFTTYSGTEVKIDNEEMLILTEDDILGVIE